MLTFRETVPWISHLYVAGNYGVQIHFNFALLYPDDTTAPFMVTYSSNGTTVEKWSDLLDTWYQQTVRACRDSGIDWMAMFPAFWADFDTCFRQVAQSAPTYRTNTNIMVFARSTTGRVGVAVF